MTPCAQTCAVRRVTRAPVVCLPYRSPSMRRPAVALACLLVALTAAACGRGERKVGTQAQDRPGLGVKGSETQASSDLGFPSFATKNTTRIGGADPIADAAGVARAVFPATSPETRPNAVALVDARDWRAGIVSAVLASTPVRAAILLSNGPELPASTRAALNALKPTGAKAAGGAQLVRVGNVARPPGLRTTDLNGRDPFALARAIDAFQTAARGTTSERVVVVSADDPAFAMPAAAWAAKAGDPVLFVHRNSIPPETRAALVAHDQPRIYVLGSPATVTARTVSALRKLGTVKRIGADNPIDNAIAFAPYIQPGYTRDPVRGVYNHGWIIGDDRAISVPTQARIDSLLEIKKAQNNQQSP